MKKSKIVNLSLLSAAFVLCQRNSEIIAQTIIMNSDTVSGYNQNEKLQRNVELPPDTIQHHYWVKNYYYTPHIYYYRGSSHTIYRGGFGFHGSSCVHS